MKRMKKIMVIAAVLLTIGAVSAAAIDYQVRAFAKPFIMSAQEVPHAEAILVLGAFVYPDGHVSTILRDRLDTAMDIYNEDKAPKLIVSGDHGRQEYDEVNNMKQYLLNHSLKDEDVFMDHAGFNTYQSMYRARDIFKTTKLIIVTQDYHLSRAIYVARKMGIDAYGVTADRNEYGAVMKKYKAREILARCKDFINVNMTKPAPKFLGEVIPITSSGILTNDK